MCTIKYYIQPFGSWSLVLNFVQNWNSNMIRFYFWYGTFSVLNNKGSKTCLSQVLYCSLVLYWCWQLASKVQSIVVDSSDLSGLPNTPQMHFSKSHLMCNRPLNASAFGMRVLMQDWPATQCPLVHRKKAKENKSSQCNTDCKYLPKPPFKSE